MYVGANINNYYYSTDAGHTWTHGILFSAQYGVWGDPLLICDTAGAFYFFHLSNPPAVDWKNNSIYVTWTQFDQYGSSNPDHFSDNTTQDAVPCVDPNGEIYVACAIPRRNIIFHS